MSEHFGRGEAVLVADDDSLIRMVLRMAIENLGHDVVDASSSDDLVTALTGRRFGLCLMDAAIPGSTIEYRLDLLEALAPDMPLIVMSGYSDKPDAVRERGLRFMSKPIGLDELADALAETGMAFGTEQGTR